MTVKETKTAIQAVTDTRALLIASGLSEKDNAIVAIDNRIAELNAMLNSATDKPLVLSYSEQLWGKKKEDLVIGDSITYKELFDFNPFTIENLHNILKNMLYQGYIVKRYNANGTTIENSKRDFDTKIVFEGFDMEAVKRYEKNVEAAIAKKKEKADNADNADNADIAVYVTDNKAVKAEKKEKGTIKKAA